MNETLYGIKSTQHSPTPATSIHDTGTWSSLIEAYDTRCFYACKHINYKQWHTGDFFNNMSASHYLQYPHFYIYSCHKLSLKFYMWTGCTVFISLCVNISQRMEIYRWNMQGSLCTAYWLCVILYTYISCWCVWVIIVTRHGTNNIKY
jgi:hypothetical protein